MLTTRELVLSVEASLEELKAEIRVKAQRLTVEDRKAFLSRFERRFVKDSQRYKNHGAQVGLISAFDAATQAELNAVLEAEP